MKSLEQVNDKQRRILEAILQGLDDKKTDHVYNLLSDFETKKREIENDFLDFGSNPDAHFYISINLTTNCQVEVLPDK